MGGAGGGSKCVSGVCWIHETYGDGGSPGGNGGNGGDGGSGPSGDSGDGGEGARRQRRERLGWRYLLRGHAHDGQRRHVPSPGPTYGGGSQCPSSARTRRLQAKGGPEPTVAFRQPAATAAKGPLATSADGQAGDGGTGGNGGQAGGGGLGGASGTAAGATWLSTDRVPPRCRRRARRRQPRPGRRRQPGRRWRLGRVGRLPEVKNPTPTRGAPAAAVPAIHSRSVEVWRRRSASTGTREAVAPEATFLHRAALSGHPGPPAPQGPVATEAPEGPPASAASREPGARQNSTWRQARRLPWTAPPLPCSAPTPAAATSHRAPYPATTASPAHPAKRVWGVRASRRRAASRPSAMGSRGERKVRPGTRRPRRWGTQEPRRPTHNSPLSRAPMAWGRERSQPSRPPAPRASPSRPPLPPAPMATSTSRGQRLTTPATLPSPTST